MPACAVLFRTTKTLAFRIDGDLRAGQRTEASPASMNVKNGGIIMKKIVPLVLLFAAMIYLLPMTALLLPVEASASASTVQAPLPVPPESTSAPTEPQLPPVSDALPVEEAPLLILDERSGEVREVPVRDFVRGAVAAEMPIDYPDEALRAQAIAAHSYALACKAQADPNDPTLKGAYFSANPDQRIGYLTETVMRAMWGDAFETNRTRLYTIVDSVLDEILLYEGEPALACYHSISNGQTESAAAIWGSEVPYLVTVDSMLDLTCPDYEQSFTITKQELAQDLGTVFPDLALAGDAANWIGAIERTAAGYVHSISIGGVSCSGTAVRSALRLRSRDFTITWTEEHLFTITTHGYGHGVGMSQYGANALALTGKTYQEILATYYPGTTLGPVPQ